MVQSQGDGDSGGHGAAPIDWLVELVSERIAPQRVVDQEETAASAAPIVATG